MKPKNSLDCFKLLPLKAAKVSEISEATAASDVASTERVNFHIGNPVQDDRLNRLYFQLVTNNENPSVQNNFISGFKSDSSQDKESQNYSDFLKNCIKNCVPYMPRGGYSRNNPGKLIERFKEWLTVGQQESLDYNFGDTSGQKEVILSSGGIWENLRILFFSISRFLIHLPANILLLDVNLPAHLKQFSSLEFVSLPVDVSESLELIKNNFSAEPDKSTFLLLGKVIPESARRELRQLSLNFPLFFIEINNAPNHLSMGREAKMLNRVLRVITPSAISPELSEMSVNFIVGNGDYIKVIESVHFELKGTPAAAEIELLNYLLKNKNYKIKNKDYIPAPNANNSGDNSKGNFENFNDNIQKIQDILGRFSTRISEKSLSIDKSLKTFSKYEQKLSDKIQTLSHFPGQYPDNFSLINFEELLDYYFSNVDKPIVSKKLEESFLSAFLNHHPEYDIRNCFVVSGSARTALSLLGFHCGISEIISIDLSWTYEHCFPKVETISLSENLDLDAESIIKAVGKKLHQNPDWKKMGAVVINNPHNATGQIFEEEKISYLLLWLLEREIYVIDDLSYQNVLPEHTIKGPKTLKQLTNQLSANGYLLQDNIKYLITVHSLSKTDCFAGARLAVIEILHREMQEKFKEIHSGIKPNNMAIILAYLFYRNHQEKVNGFWLLRNQIFSERMSALEQACDDLPTERNHFEIQIYRPSGSMYPRMDINKLPDGISLDFLASGLAIKGIGLIPLSTFARTAKGYNLTRKSFRLTLGGEDKPEDLKQKTRRVLIDLNRMIAEEGANYTRLELIPSQVYYSASDLHPTKSPLTKERLRGVIKKNANQLPNGIYIKTVKQFDDADKKWEQLSKRLNSIPKKIILKKFKDFESEKYFNEFSNNFIYERINIFKQRYKDRVEQAENVLSIARSGKRKELIGLLQNELYKDNLETRTQKFHQRLFDRTVHPTQMYALNVELVFNQVIDQLIKKDSIDSSLVDAVIHTLADEFLGLNVPINSVEEADELVADLKMMYMVEDYLRWNTFNQSDFFLSFWGDWDGSTRPSGQGHRLVMAVLIENVNRLAEMLITLTTCDTSINIESGLLNEIHRLNSDNRKSLQLSNRINSLTNELEKRYLRILPINEKVNRFLALGQSIGLIKDPISALWQHNDRLEKRMLDLRLRRYKTMEHYFSLNKRLRKTLFGLLPQIEKNLHLPEVALQFGLYRDLLQRFVLTPRIHQKIITSPDQFSIDTTIQNITEINRISGNYGNPGMVIALQVSMTTDPDAIINLDRKLRSHREQSLREYPDCNLPFIQLIPLFEDSETVRNLDSFLNKLWDYCIQSHRIDQDTSDRFSELIAEVFFAGSDLSQQVGQPASLALYKEGKLRTVQWLAERKLEEKVRIKLGSGEPMQRQGGYYDPLSGEPAFLQTNDAEERLKQNVKESTCESTQFAKSPLRGVLSGGDLRTFQSTISEKLRMLSMKERANILNHIRESQNFYKNEITRASEPLLDTRLQYKKQGYQEIEKITQGAPDELYNQFLEISTRNFRDILYGRDEDIIGIHIISYFISRSIPALRDRPTIRPSREMSQAKGQKIIERIAGTLPLSRYGSLLRAIGHNRAQTMVLGINQLSTGLFRALFEFVNSQDSFNDGIMLVTDRILPNLPVQDLLHTLRIYQDPDIHFIKEMEKAFPAGNSSFILLREDNDAINKFTIPLQKELLRRHGLDITDFFDSNGFLPQLLCTLRPDLAVLLQPDLFNTNIDILLANIGGKVEKEWIQQVKILLEIPEKVREWRKQIWTLIHDSIYQQIESFVHLSLAIYKVYEGTGGSDIAFSTEPAKVKQLSREIAGLLSQNKDDSMRQFLIAAVQYLTQLPTTMTELPIDIIHALRDVERIVKIEEQAFSKKEQDLIRFNILQMARLCGENG